MMPNELPLGMAFALAQNPSAMQAFAALGEEKKQELLRQAHSVRSKEEMQQFLDRISSQNI